MAEQLRDRGFDVLAVTEIPELIERQDEQLLERASAERRAFVTYDLADFRNISRAWAQDERPHFGLVLLTSRRRPQGSRHLGALLSALADLLVAMPADDALADREHWL